MLTLAYMNAEALERTRATGETHFWSRSRDELWHKGATSGNTQAVKALRYDCDADAILALVEPAGPACHTGERTCFHNGQTEHTAPHEALPALERTVAARAADPPAGSYTAELLADPALIGAKVQEEAEEVARAAREESDERVAEEAADVLYHLTVLLHSRGLTLADPERCSMAVAADHNVIPVTETFIEDTETPVSAFLKLRGSGPAFLLESAEQGQRVGRYSFIGVEPRKVVRWSLADGGDPYAIAAAEVAEHRQAPLADGPPFTGGAVGFFGYDCVRAVEPLGEPNPDVLGLPDMALMLSDVLVAFDHLKHTVTILANAYRDEPERSGDEASGGRARRAPASRSPRCASASPARCRARSRTPSAPSRSSSRTCRARRSRRWSPGSSSTCTPATPSRSCRASAGRRPRRSSRSRSTAGCARSTRRPTCTSSTSRTSRSSAPRPSRSSPSPAATPRRARSPAPARAAATSPRTRRSPPTCWPTRRSAPST